MMDLLHILLTCMILVSSTHAKKESARCTVKLDVEIINGECSANATEHPPENQCTETELCREGFNMSYINRKPYSYLIITDLIHTCCGHCPGQQSLIRNISKISEVTPSLMNSTTFVFPVLGRRGITKLYGYRFLPLFRTPSLYLVTLRRENMMGKILLSCARMYPLLIICMLMVMISGFLCWVMERRRNEGQFPRAFMMGWFEGIWWSFISMTTVGYGDKAPKSIPARLFSVIWIIVGIISFSLVTAMLTSEITAANQEPPPSMEDAKIGLVREHMYETIIVADEGGIILPVEENEQFSNAIVRLIHMLHQKEIDGFVLDKYEMMLYYNVYQNNPNYREANAILQRAHLSEIMHHEEFSYGIMIKNEDDYQFLKEFVSSNRDIINSCNNLLLRKYTRKLRLLHPTHSIFTTEGEIFWPTFVSCAVMVTVILICGGVYEFRQRICSVERKFTEQESLDN